MSNKYQKFVIKQRAFQIFIYMTVHVYAPVVTVHSCTFKRKRLHPKFFPKQCLTEKSKNTVHEKIMVDFSESRSYKCNVKSLFVFLFASDQLISNVCTFNSLHLHRFLQLFMSAYITTSKIHWCETLEITCRIPNAKPVLVVTFAST